MIVWILKLIGLLLGIFSFIQILHGSKNIVYLSILTLVIAYLLLKLTIFFFRRKTFMPSSSFKKVDKMTGEEFEKYLVTQFRKKRYKVQLTQLSRDYGADLIVKKGHKKYIVQAKRYSGTVGIKAVQEVIAATQYYNVSHSMVVTNSTFTKAAKELAQAANVELWDREKMSKEFNIKYTKK